MRRRGRVDGNHTEIVKALRKIGATVQSLADIGHGTPDLLVGFRGRNVLLEVKDGSLPPSRRTLTPDEAAWSLGWKGAPVIVVYNAAEAIKAVCDGWAA